MMKLSEKDYRDRVLGCWLGKNIGGTVGAPFEWKRQVNDISFYVQEDLNGDPMPNDDLDIQLLWLCALEETGLEVTAARLGEYFLAYVTPHWAEYGTAKINMRQGLLPPLCGTFQNIFKHSCGAYIRSEIWACIAPGLPSVAASYAYEDAIVDHGDGEGTYAEIFMAAVESAAFVIGDLRELIGIGLSYIPVDCGVAEAVRTTLECFEGGRSWLEARDEILRRHRGGTHLGRLENTSSRDRELGFHEGVLGYDVPSNIALTLVGLLWGGEDFARVQCTAVNCGEDTDCTAATAGALWGILHGAGAIPESWVRPIGRGIKTISLNLGELGYFGNQLPQTVDELTERTAAIAKQMLLREGTDFHAGAAGSCGPPPTPDSLKARDQGRSIWRWMSGPRFDFDFFTLHLDYGEDGPLLRNGRSSDVKVTVLNRYKTQANLSFRWYLPEGWNISPAPTGYAVSFPRHMGSPLELDFTVTAENVSRSTSRAVLEVTAEGRPSVMEVPVLFISGNYSNSFSKTEMKKN